MGPRLKESVLENGDLGKLPSSSTLVFPKCPQVSPRVPQVSPRVPSSPSSLPTIAGAAQETQALKGGGETSSPSRIQGLALSLQQLRALITKRFLLACRSRRGLFAQVGTLSQDGESWLAPRLPQLYPYSARIACIAPPFSLPFLLTQGAPMEAELGQGKWGC